MQRILKVSWDAFSCPFVWDGQEIPQVLECLQHTWVSRSGLSGEGFALIPEGAVFIQGRRIDAVSLKDLREGVEVFRGHGSNPEALFLAKLWGGRSPQGDKWKEHLVSPPWWTTYGPGEEVVLHLWGTVVSEMNLLRRLLWPLWVQETREANELPRIERGGVQVSLEKVRSLEKGELRMPFYRDESGLLWEVGRDGELVSPTAVFDGWKFWNELPGPTGDYPEDWKAQYEAFRREM